MRGHGWSNKYTKRQVEYVDDKTLKVYGGYYGSSSVTNYACIPVKIIGYKY